MGREHFVQLPHTLRVSLRQAGERIPPLREILGEASGLRAFSDYRHEKGQYRTSTLFVTTQEGWDSLSARLAEIRVSHRISSRFLQYKDRRRWRRQWPGATAAWMAAIRETPSLTICVAYSERFGSEPASQQIIEQATKLLRQSGRAFDGAATLSLAQKLSPFDVLMPLLDQGVLGWVSDHDSILQGDIGTETFAAVLDCLNPGVALVQPTYTGDLPLEAEWALTLPDIVSGTVADFCPVPLEPTTFRRGDAEPEGLQLLVELARMGVATAADETPAKLHVSLVDGNGIHQTIEFRASGTDRRSVRDAGPDATD